MSSVRREVVFLLLAALMMAGCQPQPGTDHVTASSPQQVDESVFAYIKSTQLVVMRGNKVVAQVDRLFDEADPARNRVAWTADEAFLFMLSDALILQEDSSSLELIYVNTRTGEQGRLPCPSCTDVLALDADRVAARYYDRDAKQSMLLEFDLNAPGAGTPVPVTPALGRVVARTTDFLLTRPDSLNSPYDVNVLRAEDWSTDFGGFVGTNNYLQGASVESVGTYQRFAIAYSPDSGECESIFHIDVIWPAPGQIVPTVLSAFAPTGYTLGQQSGNEVNDLWWDDQGDLFASVRSWTCTAGTSELERKRVAAPSQIWQLTSSNTWTKQSSETATTARPLQDGSRILLRIPECVGPTDTGDTPPQIYCNVGDLYREKSGARELIAEEVIWISTPSPISTAPPTGSATAVAPTSASVEPAASAYPGE